MMTHTGQETVVESHIRDGHSLPSAVGALIGGVVVILGAISPPVDDAADRAFSAHMLQHVVFFDAGAPLLAIAWPLLLGRWRSSRVVAGLNALARPAPALVLSTIALWFWHIPAIYDAALGHEATHVLEHVVFIATFVLFWRPLMNDTVTSERLRTNESRVLYLTIGMFANALLAAYITFADHLLYSHYALLPPGGRSPLADQHLGGGIMWLVGTIAVTVAALLTMRDEP
ncbi:MAG TPA: cytochrome c oxidase assembly protein [Tepidisphaeraceae bacterium]|jgi:putative membrane protein